jgi:hypothetical protein
MLDSAELYVGLQNAPFSAASSAELRVFCRIKLDSAE